MSEDFLYSYYKCHPGENPSESGWTGGWVKRSWHVSAVSARWTPEHHVRIRKGALLYFNTLFTMSVLNPFGKRKISSLRTRPMNPSC